MIRMTFATALIDINDRTTLTDDQAVQALNEMALEFRVRADEIEATIRR